MDSITMYRTLRRLAKKRGIVLDEDLLQGTTPTALWYLSGSFEAIAISSEVHDMDQRAFLFARSLGQSHLYRNMPRGTRMYDPQSVPLHCIKVWGAAVERYAKRLITRLKGA